MPGDPALQIAAWVPHSETEGPHRRCVVWVQGCSLRCPGCCNPEMFEANAGHGIAVDTLLERIATARRVFDLEGLTVLGGEPLDQLSGATALLAGARAMGLGVLVFTGYRLEEARRKPGFDRVWKEVDTLVDGRFAAARPEPRRGRRYIGSTNQRILHRTLRYADPSLWRGAPRVEVRIGVDGTLSVVGFPTEVADLARALW